MGEISANGNEKGNGRMLNTSAVKTPASHLLPGKRLNCGIWAGAKQKGLNDLSVKRLRRLPRRFQRES